MMTMTLVAVGLLVDSKVDNWMDGLVDNKGAMHMQEATAEENFVVVLVAFSLKKCRMAWLNQIKSNR